MGYGVALIKIAIAALVGGGLFQVGLGLGDLGPGLAHLGVLAGQVLTQAVDVGLRLGHRHLEVLGVEERQGLPLFDVVVVVHQHLGYPSCHLGGNHADKARHVGVVGGDIDGADMPIVKAAPDGAEQDQDN